MMYFCVSAVCRSLSSAATLSRKQTGRQFLFNSYRKMHYKQALMCSPDHYEVGQLINPWMGGTVDKSKAWDQWNALRSAVEAAGVKVNVIEQKEGLTDMVFACNAGIVRHNKVYLSAFRHPVRAPERDVFCEWFKNNKFEVLGLDNSDYFEGGGDCFFAKPDLLLAGYGYRTDKKVYGKLNGLTSTPFRTIYCQLVHPDYYHMDTCLVPLNHKQAVYYPAAFEQSTIDELSAELELIAVDKEEAEHFACNLLPVPHSNTVIAPLGCGRLGARLQSMGMSFVEVDMSEFMKSGGATQCLVLKMPEQ